MKARPSLMERCLAVPSRIYRARTAYLFLLPGLVLFVLFLIYPMAYSLRISFYDWNVIKPLKSEFVGLDNYKALLADPIFRRAVLNTLAYTAITVPAQMILALAVAILLDQRIRGKTFFRVAYYLPVITSWVIVTLIFEYLFNSQAGLINYLLRDLLGLVGEPIRWLADPILTMVPINLLGIWKGVGWSAIILLAALQAIPAELLEAAAIDGAKPGKRFWTIVFPLLSPTVFFLIVVNIVYAFFDTFGVIHTITDGGPNHATDIMVFKVYHDGFLSLDLGGSAAQSVVLMFVVITLTVIQFRYIERKVHY